MENLYKKLRKIVSPDFQMGIKHIYINLYTHVKYVVFAFCFCFSCH